MTSALIFFVAIVSFAKKKMFKIFQRVARLKEESAKRTCLRYTERLQVCAISCHILVPEY